MHWVLFATASFSLIAHPGYGGMLEYSFDIRGIKESLLSQVSGVFYLLSKLILPFSLNIDPDLPVLSKWTPLLAIKAGILSALFCTGLIRFRRVPVVGFGILWFFLVLLPTNSFVPRLDVANERQLYFSSWGLFAVVSAAAARVQARARSNFIYWIIIAILAALFCSTLLRNHVYRSEISLWEDTVRKSPRKPRAYNNLGYAYAISGRYAEAKKAYRQALNLNPDYEPALANLRALPKNVQ
jgi:tetratricopeptide (TPR) repeat protein